MNKRENTLKNIVYFSMIFSLIYIFGLVIKLDLSFILQVFIVFSGSVIVKFLILNPMFIYIVIIFSFFFILTINHFFPLFISPFFQKTISLLSNIFHNLRGHESIASENILFFWIILIVFLAFYTGFIIFKNKNIYLLIPVYITLFLYYWYNYIDVAYWMMILFIFLFFILMSLNKYDAEVFKKDKLLIPDYKDLYLPWIKTGVIYAIIIITLATLLPKTSNVIKWSWLQDKIYESFPEVENWRSSNKFSRQYGVASYFDFSLTGYESTPSKLGGPVELSDKKIMTIYADSPQYLRGNIKHKYTGEYWEIVRGISKSHSSGQDFSNLSKLEKREFYEKSSIKILYNSFSSKTIFSPYRPTRINFQDNSKLIVDKDYGVSAPEGIYTGESYTITIHVPLPYTELLKSDIYYTKDDIIDLNKYLQIPHEKITKDTKELTKNIVKGLNTDLDKAMAIEEYLRDNYEYSLDVSPIPENEEFIDYFLFKEKKGYCTYYATTLAIMLRLENIPSRYIEGYLAKESKKKGIYEVTQENAHTWVEAFIEPIGWISLEPTPAYPIISRASETRDSKAPEETDNNPQSSIPNRELLYQENNKLTNNQENLLNGNANIPKDNAGKNKITINKKQFFLIILSVLFSILTIRVLFVFIKLKYRDYKIRRSSPRKRIVYLYNDILKLATALGYPQNYGETHSEYANRIAFNFYYFDDKSIKEITEIFIKNKYGNSPVPEVDILEMENFKNNVKVRMRNHLGILRYLVLYLKL